MNHKNRRNENTIFLSPIFCQFLLVSQVAAQRPSDLFTILFQSTDYGRKMRVPALQLLLRGQPTDKPDLAKLASPVSHLDKQDPRLMLIHGDADPQMPQQQAREFAQAYESQKLPVQFIILAGGKHGGAAFYDTERTTFIATFLKPHLQPKSFH